MSVSAAWAVALLLACLVAAASVSRGSGERPRALVAKQLIREGTPGRLLVERRMFAVSSEQAGEGVVSDPSYFAGRVALRNVYPGELLSVSSFTTR